MRRLLGLLATGGLLARHPGTTTPCCFHSVWVSSNHTHSAPALCGPLPQVHKSDLKKAVVLETRYPIKRKSGAQASAPVSCLRLQTRAGG